MTYKASCQLTHGPLPETHVPVGSHVHFLSFGYIYRLPPWLTCAVFQGGPEFQVTVKHETFSGATASDAWRAATKRGERLLSGYDMYAER